MSDGSNQNNSREGSTSSENDSADEEMTNRSTSSSDSDADYSFDLAGDPLHPESAEHAPWQLVAFEAASNDIKHAAVCYGYEGDEKQKGFLRVRDGRLSVCVKFNNELTKAEDLGEFVLILPQPQGPLSLQLTSTPDPEHPEVVSSSGDDYWQADMAFNVEPTNLKAEEFKLGGVVLYRAYLGYHDRSKNTDFAIPFRVRRSSNQ